MTGAADTPLTPAIPAPIAKSITIVDRIDLLPLSNQELAP
jgi:hypothetical protein